MDKKIVGLALIMSFMWGIQPFIYKYLLSNVSHCTIILLTCITDLICIIIYSYYNRETIMNDNITMHIVVVIVLTTIFTIFLLNICYYHILKDTKSYVVNTLSLSAPIFTLLVGYFLLNEIISVKEVIGIITIAVGTYLIL
jgi:drug/metabolite transporter (DMT)-like permease